MIVTDHQRETATCNIDNCCSILFNIHVRLTISILFKGEKTKDKPLKHRKKPVQYD